MNYKAIHHTAVQTKGNQLDAVNRYHRDVKDFSKSSLGWYVGYNIFIDTDGTRTNTRAIGEETMAQIGHNFDTISICLAGNFNENLPNEKQLVTLRRVLKELNYKYPEAELTLHRKLQANRTCPGKLFTEDYLDVIVQGLFVEQDDEDKVKKQVIEAELEKSQLMLMVLQLKLQVLQLTAKLWKTKK